MLSYLEMTPQIQSKIWKWTPSKMAVPISEPPWNRQQKMRPFPSLLICLEADKCILLFLHYCYRDNMPKYLGQNISQGCKMSGWWALLKNVFA